MLNSFVGQSMGYGEWKWHRKKFRRVFILLQSACDLIWDYWQYINLFYNYYEIESNETSLCSCVFNTNQVVVQPAVTFFPFLSIHALIHTERQLFSLVSIWSLREIISFCPNLQQVQRDPSLLSLPSPQELLFHPRPLGIPKSLDTRENSSLKIIK